MKRHRAHIAASRSEFDRFEYLARRLFAVGKNELERARTNYESRKGAAREIEKSRSVGFPENLRRFAMKALEKSPLQCSFCGKTTEQVQFLLAGGGTPPTVYICGGCVETSAAIIEKTKASGSAPPAPN